jgi:hypothetical protein
VQRSGSASAAFKLFGGLFIGPCHDRGIVSIPAAAHTRGLQRKHDAWSVCRKIFSVIGALWSRKPHFTLQSKPSMTEACELSHTWTDCHYFS